MEQEELRKLFCTKLTLELRAFQMEMFKSEKEEIYERAFQIDSMVRIYRQCMELSRGMEAELLCRLTVFPDLLSFLYDCWLKQEDSVEEELAESIEKSLSEITEKENSSGRREAS
ncbi:MAG: DUF3848 domain-containing protein [Lachnospiraceae bacterium]|nr:DUF3848 domain-containing protein [Lachnospiraceae bacterium]